MSIKDITIVITSFKSDEIIRNCLNSIDNQCEIILVENSNNIDFKTNLEKDFKNVKCFLTGENFGYGKANNIGLNKVKTKYALILNPDASLYPSTLNDFISSIEKVPDFAIIAPFNQDQKNQNNKFEERNLTPMPVNNVKGFAMFLNISQFKDVGFFDESFFIYIEEMDLCKRLINLNKKIYLAPKVKINHSGGQSHNKSINEEMELSRNWHWMWSTFNYHKKHKGFLVSLLIVFPKLSSALIKVIIYSIIFNKNKRKIYYQRLSGLVNAISGKNSWYRPKV